MSAMSHQAEANQKSEAGIFYPTGYIVSAFADRTAAEKARAGLQAQGFGEADLKYVPAAEMARAARQNLENPSFFASVGSSLPTRQKQLELAQQGCEFLLIHAPEPEDEERVLRALSDVPTRYAVKYKRLIIENMLQHIPMAGGGAASRVA